MQTLACKKCKKCFRKDVREFEEWYVSRGKGCLDYHTFPRKLNLLRSDEYCPHCDNHFLLEAKVPKATSNAESAEVRVDSSMLKDYRVEGEQQRSIFDPDHFADRLG